MNAEADFATSVFLRVVHRLMEAEQKIAKQVEVLEKQGPKWSELYELVKDEPEYERMMKAESRVDFLDCAIAVLKRKKGQP